MSKKGVLGLLKWVFAMGILYALIRSGKLSLTEVKNFLANPTAAFLCLAMVGTVFCGAFFRWKTLLATQQIYLSYWKTFRIGMLGQFFSAVIPGTVGGDLVKAVYVARRFPSRKVKTVSTIFLDRLIGLAAMLVLGAIAFLIGRPQFRDLPPAPGLAIVISLGWVLVALGGAVVAGLAVYPLVSARLPAEAPALLRRLPLSTLWVSLYEIAISFRHSVTTLWATLILSMGMHCLNIGVLWVAAQSVFGPAPWGPVSASLFVVAAVLGLCAMAIPVAPLGLGVGQLAFAGIFSALAIPNPVFGVTIVTVSQLVNLTMNLCGAIFFATYRHEVEDAAAQSC